jgi:hypothetical protein
LIRSIYVKVHLVHPKFLNDELLQLEHDFMHQLFDSLTAEEKGAMEHPDLFRYKGRRGQLYIRHRKVVEEISIRGMIHDTLFDRRGIEAEEWGEPEVTSDDVYEEVEELRDAISGRVVLPEKGEPKDFTCLEDLCSVVPGITELDILRGLWKIYRHVVMERSYSRYRSLQDPLQGQGRGSVWMLFDLMMEEAFAQVPEERAPAIAYETIWEALQDGAGEKEIEAYRRLYEDLEPGKVSLDMRRFLASVAGKQGNEDLKISALLSPYI